MLDLAAIFITLTTVLTWINYKYMKMPPAIGVMFNALLLSVIIQIADMCDFPYLKEISVKFLLNIDFSDILMTWFLPALLFAGSLHVNLKDLSVYKWPIGLLATGGIVVSTFVIGYSAHFLLALFGWNISIFYCLAFGALISPTDPIAVMGILKTTGAPKPLRMTIIGESLGNDGVAVVIFGLLLGIIALGHEPSVADVTVLFVQEAIGGLIFGGIIGLLGFLMLRTIDQHQVAVMLTFAMVFGGSALAAKLHVSSPISMVVAGLILGNYSRNIVMSENSRRYVDAVWECIDEVLNSLLFVLIGLELLILPFSWMHVIAAAALSVVVLVARFLTIGPAIMVLRGKHLGGRQIDRGAIRILTWGGLRGGISLALALSLPLGPERDLILVLTYIVVLASILLQGLTIGKMVKVLYGEKKRPPTAYELETAAIAAAEAQEEAASEPRPH
jgi:CPA1 family monovalent cation:H+ antiporter